MRLKGKQIVLSVGGTPLSLVRDCSFNAEREMQEVASPSSGDAKEVKPGRYAWSMDSAHLVGNFNQNTLLNYLINKTKLNIAIGTVVGVSEQFSFSGYAYVKSFKMGAPLHGFATANVTFQGTGTISTSSNQPTT